MGSTSSIVQIHIRHRLSRSILTFILLTLLPPPFQIPLEEIDQDLCHEHLLNGVQQHGNLNIRPRQVVRAGPHGTHQRDSKARRLGCSAEAHGDGLFSGHLFGLEGHGQVFLKEGSVDEGFGGAGGEEADEGEDDIEGDVDEDVEEDGAS